MDSDNILSILASLGQNPAPFAAPGISVPPATPEGGITPLTYQPLPEASSSPTVNVLQDIAAPTYAAAPDPQQSAALAIGNMSPPTAEATEPPRKRRSVIETIGRLADVFAKVGGAEALYEPTLNARADRANQIDMDALRKQLAQQQVAAGAEAPQDAMRGRIAQALGAVAGNPNAAALWPSIAQEAGIDPQRAQAIGNIITQNPDAAGIFAQSLGYQPAARGSVAKELQVYGLLQQASPELAGRYLQSLANPDSMNENQRAQLQIDLARLGIAQQEFGLKQAESERKAAGGADLTPTQRGVVRQKMALLPTVRQQLQNVRALAGQMQEEGTLARGGIGGLLPGAIAGGTADRFDKALGALRKSILSITRTPGIGSMSNYETALDEMQLPSRWGSDEGRAEAINGIDQLLQGLETGYTEMIGTPSAAAPAPRASNSNRPAARPRSGNRPTTVRAPKAGEVRQGYRFKGGNPADRNSWEKVQ